MELKSLELADGPDAVQVRCAVRFNSGGSETLWYAVPRHHAAHLATERYDGPLVGLLLKAMETGEDVEIRGAVSERLLFNLTHYYMAIVSRVRPGLRPVRILPERLDVVSAAECPSGAGTGFSAGIDSFALLHDHYLNEARPGWRVTHLLFNNVGSHGDRDFTAARRLFQQRFAAVRGYPAGVGLEFIPVDSNLSDLLQMDFQATHTPRNISVALLFQKLFRRYYYASTFRYEDCFVGPTYDMAFADPFSVHLLSTETLDCVSSGSQLTRVEKTRRVASVPDAERWLNVCTTVAAGGRNCGRCSKCCRTLMTLDMLGELDRFAGAFDMSAWRRVRNRYVSSQVLNSRERTPFIREIRELAASTGYRFTAWQEAATVLNALPRPVMKLGRSLRRRYLGGP